MEMIDSALCIWILCGFCRLRVQKQTRSDPHPFIDPLMSYQLNAPQAQAYLSIGIPVQSGPGWKINIHHLQEIIMGSVCLELVPMNEPTNPFHHQPLQFFVLIIKHCKSIQIWSQAYIFQLFNLMNVPKLRCHLYVLLRSWL